MDDDVKRPAKEESEEGSSGDEDFRDALESLNVSGNQSSGAHDSSLVDSDGFIKKTETYSTYCDVIKDNDVTDSNITIDSDVNSEQTAQEGGSLIKHGASVNDKDAVNVVTVDPLNEEKPTTEAECDDGSDEENAGPQMTDIDEEGIKARDSQLTQKEKESFRDEAQSIKENGNKEFKSGEYEEAIKSYTDALQLCPLYFLKERSIMYSNRAACRMKLEKNEEAIQDSTRALELNPNYLKALLRRAELYEKTEKLDEALADYTKAVEMDPSQRHAREACMRLPEQIKERNEKMKEEMMGKLKDLGNMILRPFGMSTENFKFQQDPHTGSYSVNFVNNQPPQ